MLVFLNSRLQSSILLLKSGRYFFEGADGHLVDLMNSARGVGESIRANLFSQCLLEGDQVEIKSTVCTTTCRAFELGPTRSIMSLLWVQFGLKHVSFLINSSLYYRWKRTRRNSKTWQISDSENSDAGEKLKEFSQNPQNNTSTKKHLNLQQVKDLTNQTLNSKQRKKEWENLTEVIIHDVISVPTHYYLGKNITQTHHI